MDAERILKCRLESLSYLEGIVNRDMDVTGDPGEGSQRKELERKLLSEN